jgi:ubiquitin-like protein Pup
MPQTKPSQTKASSPAPVKEAGGAPAARVTGTGSRLSASIDRIVDEIDSVLEENAAEFVKGYVQRGGE